jgi:pyruvate kinase
MAKILKETEMNLYSNCDRLDCDDCFGVVHKGRMTRSGFETITFMRQKKIEKSTKKVVLKRKFSCNGLNMRKNSIVENMINILPFITDDLDCIITINNFDDGEYMKNVSASRINIPMFAFCNREILANQLNFVWNVRSIYEKKIGNDFFENVQIIDEFIEENLMKKYLLIADLTPDGKNTMIQIRTI